LGITKNLKKCQKFWNDLSRLQGEFPASGRIYVRKDRGEDQAARGKLEKSSLGRESRKHAERAVIYSTIGI